MSNLITGTHLIREELEHPVETRRELANLSDILEKAEFNAVRPVMLQCVNKDIVKQQVRKVITLSMGYSDHELSRLEYEVFRVVEKARISFGRPAYLVPVGTSEYALHIGDSAADPVAVTVGQRTFFNRPIIIEPGTFLVIRAKESNKRAGREEKGQEESTMEGWNEEHEQEAEVGAPNTVGAGS